MPLEEEGLLGWATTDLVRLDGLSPGLISRALTASPMIRNAILLVLAHRRHDRLFGGLGVGTDDDDAPLAKALRRERARAIIEHVFGSVEDGLLGALARLDAASLPPPGAYIRLHALFRHAHYRSGEALQHVGVITDMMLRVLDTLDPRWVHRETLTRIEGPAEAVAFNRAVAFAQAVSSRATDGAVAGAIARMQPTTTLISLVERFVRRADRFPPHPLKADAELRPLASVPDFLGAARAYRNCLGKRIEDALVGQAAYAEFRGEAIIELRPLSDAFGWILCDVYVARNRPAPKAIRQAAEAKCSALGIPHVDHDTGRERLRHYRWFVLPPDFWASQSAWTE